MISMSLAMLIITLTFFVFHDPSIAWVFISYALGGVGIGNSKFPRNFKDFSKKFNFLFRNF
jgi:hypothetical protein